MSRAKFALLSSSLIAVALAGTLAVTSRSQQPAAGPRLPGARPAIEAGDYPSLQAAIDALPATGGVVRLPAGTFEIREPLRITQEDVLLVGAGTATHIKNVNTSGQPALVVESPEIAAKPQAVVWRIELADLRLTGNEQSGHGIHARNVNEIFLHGITVSYHGGDGVRLDQCYEDPRICDSLFTYNKACGVNLLGCHDIVVVGNQFEENLDALQCSDGFNLCMTGNNLDDHLRDGVVIANTYGSVVSGNMIEECQGRAIVLGRDCYGTTLSANVIAHEVAGGIDLIDAHGCTVSSNTFTIVKQNALRIGPASGRITVTGNNFSSSFIGEGKDKRAENDRTASGIVLAGARDIAITGNVFSGLSTKAVELAGDKPSEGILFTNNVLVDVESDLKQE
jgi:hypothetical protein